MSGNGAMMTPSAGATVTMGVDGSQTLEVKAETAGAAVAKWAEAQVFIRSAMAERRPRSWEKVERRLTDDSKRPGFAEEAMYKKPVGNTTINGPSVRLAEAFATAMGNLYAVQGKVIWDDQEKRIAMVVTMDLESNLTYEQEIVTEKTVERRDKRPDAISSRKNKSGQTVYLVPATDDEIQNKQAAMVSKAYRNQVFRMVPSDILDRVLEVCKATLDTDAKKNLPTIVPKMMKQFAALKPAVTQEDIEKYLGRPVFSERGEPVIKPGDVVELRSIYNAILAHETTWREIMDQRNSQATESIRPLSQVLEQAAAAAVANSPAPPHDTVTGEVIEAKPEPTGDEMADAILAATTLAQLDEMVMKVRALPKGPRRDQLATLIGERRGKVTT